MPGSVPHVHHVVALTTVPVAPEIGSDPLEVECAHLALHHSLWVALFLAQQLRLTEFQHHLSRLLRDVDRRRDELGLL